MSSVRLDNYVFTRESFSAARRLLRFGGSIVVTAATFRHWFRQRLVTTFEGSAGKRTIKHGDTDTLKFKFQNNAVAGSYAITVEFANGCAVQIP